jgi:uncharacterized protein (DUF2236 family)
MPSADGTMIDQAQARKLLVGPQSVCWRYASDVRLNLVILYPLLLQVAHPSVGAGVRDFSHFERDPYERLLRTVDYVTLLVYGGEDAIAAGRRLRALHKRFRGVRDDGRRYHALEPAAYAWVHATLLHTHVAGHTQFGRPMRPVQVERFYGEYRALGRLIGVRERDLPETWRGFCEYFERVSRTELTLNDSVRRVLRAVGLGGPPLVPMPAAAWSLVRIPTRRAIWLGGIGLIEPELRERLEIPWSVRDELEFRTLGRLTRAMTPVLPAGLQVSGPAQLAARREAIAQGPLGDGRDGLDPLSGPLDGLGDRASPGRSPRVPA